MFYKTISDLPDISTSLSDSAEVEILQGGSSYRSSLAQIRKNVTHDFVSWANFATEVANGFTATNGHVVRAAGVEFKALSGSTMIPGLPGWVPNGVPSVLHFLQTAADGVYRPLSDGYANLAAAQAIYPKCTSLTQSYDDMAFQYMIDSVRNNSINAPRTLEIDRATGNNSSNFVAYIINRGAYYLTRSVDWTGLGSYHSFTGIMAEGAVILGATAGKATFDFLSSRKIAYLGTLTMIGVWTEDGVPRCGIQIGRSSDGSASDSHVFEGGWEVRGRFSLGAFYNYASEDVRWGATAGKNELDPRVNHCNYVSGVGSGFTTEEEVTWSGGTGFVALKKDNAATGEVAIRVITGTLSNGTVVTGGTSGMVATISGTPNVEPNGEGPNGRSYVLVQDGDNKWGVTSDYVSVAAVNTVGSFLRNTGYVDMRHTGRGDTVWFSRTFSHDFSNSYFVSSDSDGGAAVVLYSNTVAQSNIGLVLDCHVESDAGDTDPTTGINYDVKFESVTARTVTIPNLRFRRKTSSVGYATFYAGTNVNAVVMNGCLIDVGTLTRDTGQVLFSDPSKFTLNACDVTIGELGTGPYINISSIANFSGSLTVPSIYDSSVQNPNTSGYDILDTAGNSARLTALTVMPKGSGTTSDVLFKDTAGTQRGRLRATSSLMSMHSGTGTAGFNLSTTTLYPTTASGLALGSSSLPFGDVWARGRIAGSSQSITVDTVVSEAPPNSSGMIMVMGPGTTGCGIFHFTATSCTLLSGGANVAASTSVLTGTTGTSGNLTVSSNGGNIQIENRISTGAVRWIYLL